MIFLAAGIDGQESYTLFSKETGRKKIKGPTRSVLTHRAPRDPKFATLLATPSYCFSSGSVQGRADGSLFAGRRHHHLTLVLKSPLVALRMCGSFLAIAGPFPVQAGEAPEGIPSRHLTHTSHPGISPIHPIQASRPYIPSRHPTHTSHPGIPPVVV